MTGLGVWTKIIGAVVIASILAVIYASGRSNGKEVGLIEGHAKGKTDGINAERAVWTARFEDQKREAMITLRKYPQILRARSVIASQRKQMKSRNQAMAQAYDMFYGR